jgi:hypothetical protein
MRVIVLNNLYDFLPVVLMFIKVVNFLPLPRILPSSRHTFVYGVRGKKRESTWLPFQFCRNDENLTIVIIPITYSLYAPTIIYSIHSRVLSFQHAADRYWARNGTLQNSEAGSLLKPVCPPSTTKTVVAKRSSNNILTPAAIASALAVILVTVVLSRGPAPGAGKINVQSASVLAEVSVPIQYVVIPVSTSITTYPLVAVIPIGTVLHMCKLWFRPSSSPLPFVPMSLSTLVCVPMTRMSHMTSCLPSGSWCTS